MTTPRFVDFLPPIRNAFVINTVLTLAKWIAVDCGYVCHGEERCVEFVPHLWIGNMLYMSISLYAIMADRVTTTTIEQGMKREHRGVDELETDECQCWFTFPSDAAQQEENDRDCLSTATNSKV
jgi:hypothetical protein